MIIPFNIGEKTYQIRAYNTAQEKEILLLSSFDIVDIKQVFEVLNFFDYEDLTEDEMKVILYKHREISLGDDIQIKFKCDNCHQVNENTLSTEKIIIPAKRSDKDIKKKFKQFKEENIHEYVDVNVDELDIDVYERLVERIIDNQERINFIQDSRCSICNTEKLFNIGDMKFIIEIMSDDTLMTLYKTYNFLNFFGNYSKSDIDTMYPFERNIFVGLLKKTKEDMNR